MRARIRRRHAAERRFRLYGLFAIGVAVLTLGGLLYSITSKGYSAFWQTQLRLDVSFDPAVLGVAEDIEGAPPTPLPPAGSPMNWL